MKAGVNNLQGDEARSATDITGKAITEITKNKLKNSAAAKKTKDGIATTMTATFDTVAKPIDMVILPSQKGVRVPVISTGVWDPFILSVLVELDLLPEFFRLLEFFLIFGLIGLVSIIYVARKK